MLLPKDGNEEVEKKKQGEKLQKVMKEVAVKVQGVGKLLPTIKKA